MIRTDDGRILEAVSELPEPRVSACVYLDVETTSGDRKVKALHPYLGHRICGVAAAIDDGPAVYAPIRHRAAGSVNLPVEAVHRWCGDLLSDAATQWVNHGIKFDRHCLHCEGVGTRARMVDTLTLARMAYSDRSSFGLKELGADLLELPAWDDPVDSWCKDAKTKDYGEVPIAILGKYALKDVTTTRALHARLSKDLPAECAYTWGIEQQLTPILWDMERRGLRLAPRVEVEKEAYLSLNRMILLTDRISQLAATEFTDSAQKIHEILCVRKGLPILARSKKTNGPSFDEEALLAYAIHPQVVSDPEAAELVRLILDYREEDTYRTLFLDSFLTKADANNTIHPIYNQVVRTGRMSCSDPNAQQMNQRAKRLIVPRPGMGFMSKDASQIEFRIIGDYIRDRRVIDAYTDDPNTDFHKWVAQLVEIGRKPAKNFNFALAYGAGEAKILRMLAASDEIVKLVGDEVDLRIEAGELEPSARRTEFMRRCQDRARIAYRRYHERLPGIQYTSKRATRTASGQGYVTNRYGRRRILNSRRCHVAFNTAVQGSAMDFIKERIPLAVEVCGQFGIDIALSVHDELLFEGEPRDLEAASAELDRVLTDAGHTGKVQFLIPILWKTGPVVTGSWAEAHS